MAKLTGKPRAYQAVRNILNKSAPPAGGWRTKIPCHRVIRSDGKVGGYRYGTERKITLLKKEGMIIKNGQIASRSPK
ncbi:MAG: hypothetical protein COX88_02130 [Candidatus Nealsonbacteria bacterium CG_4_10_14_0_2_um_filter_35_20]|uniref:Methylated-DNA-[protein]-cysteine S-methyltransferase DNA binding domain-containing protein n=1 Tax=Candidatus Nealsonbacteria bacterium CG02_land_8_20_14_3_00_34_20 TaxID=1974698 RepID=A0A2M7DAI1_9BACT|nr:MAG: hypothetical protein COS24_02175 [Candidatus Nealsonbacteria bacterium CG02_land_8_20_14_3_00_34_20]PIW92522.1 MAG: hypothetical protein COZ88_01845 [Candidatus Nealsonbacteria bacterium CG_4_8_14_3_um_filter_34_13]PIZ89750.1 MAG: hypothetical protein COX88_02130 [Candidatus Nealsonbacteria bacterium CG_4_10_14_0_2_um_filter_35_20]